MYVLESLIATYRDIVEQQHFLETLVTNTKNQPQFVNGVIVASRFFDNAVHHQMKVEEEILYPVLKRCIPRAQIGLITNLEREHMRIRTYIKGFSDGVQLLLHTTKEEDRQTLVGLWKDLLGVVIPHAQSESKTVPLLVREHFKSEHYHEVEAHYFEAFRT
jgi:hemerythrin-like domain-containing protein